MGVSFKVNEPRASMVEPGSPFRCGERDSAAVEILRLLLGTADLAENYSGRVKQCRFDFLRLRSTRRTPSDRHVATSIFDNEVSIIEAKRLMINLARVHKRFFENLRSEVEHCLYARLLNRNVESFLYLYRAIEKIAVAFPLMYISSQQDFGRVYALLEPLFTKDKGSGELNFIKKFCVHLAANSEFLTDYKITFQFVGSSVEEYDAILMQMRRACSDSHSKFILGDRSFDLPYNQVGAFIVECRNRLFHNSNTGVVNFDIDAIGGASMLCAGLLEAGIHWLTLTYMEVLKNRASVLPPPTASLQTPPAAPAP